MPKIKSDDLVRELYAKIREMILAGRLSPGEKLTQEELAGKLGVSRTPLLRALQLLEGDMLVVSIPRRGMYVRKMTMPELRDAFQLRTAVESMCAELAAVRMSEEDIENLRDLFRPFEADLNHCNMLDYQKADHEFHTRILEGSENMIIKGMPVIRNILRITYHYGLIRLPAQTLNEHNAIIDAIANRDSSGASAAMRAHLSTSIESIEQRIADSAENAGS